eukprot:122881-Prymnesium_polylepis.1
MALDDPVFIAFLDDWNRVRRGWPSNWDFGSEAYIGHLRMFGCRILGSAERPRPQPFAADPPIHERQEPLRRGYSQ